MLVILQLTVYHVGKSKSCMHIVCSVIVTINTFDICFEVLSTFNAILILNKM